MKQLRVNVAAVATPDRAGAQIGWAAAAPCAEHAYWHRLHYPTRTSQRHIAAPSNRQRFAPTLLIPERITHRLPYTSTLRAQLREGGRGAHQQRRTRNGGDDNDRPRNATTPWRRRRRQRRGGGGAGAPSQIVTCRRRGTHQSVYGNRATAERSAPCLAWRG